MCFFFFLEIYHELLRVLEIKKNASAFSCRILHTKQFGYSSLRWSARKLLGRVPMVTYRVDSEELG